MVGKSKKHFFTLTLAIICYGVALFINKDLAKPKITVAKQDSAINFNNTFLKIFSVGNKRFLSDLIWIQTLLESDESHYKKADLNSWMYIRFNNIAELDPYFYQNYLWGGVYLSIIKDDRLGAAEIFEKGLNKFPEDYDLNYNAGFNYYAQLNNYQRAYELFSKIQHHQKAPPFLPTLTAKIQFQSTFDYDATLAILYEQYNKIQDEFLKNKIRGNIYSLKATRDLKCLNENRGDCEKADLDGTPYKFKDGKYTAPKDFIEYKIHQNL